MGIVKMELDSLLYTFLHVVMVRILPRLFACSRRRLQTEAFPVFGEVGRIDPGLAMAM